MASLTYTTAKDKLADGLFTWASLDVRAMLLGGSYTADAAHDFVDDVVAHELSATGYARQALVASAPAVDGDDVEFPAGDATFPITSSGDTVTGLVLYAHVTDDTDSWLICWTDEVEGLTTGASVVVKWQGGAVRIT